MIKHIFLYVATAYIDILLFKNIILHSILTNKRNDKTYIFPDLIVEH